MTRKPIEPGKDFNLKRTRSQFIRGQLGNGKKRTKKKEGGKKNRDYKKKEEHWGGSRDPGLKPEKVSERLFFILRP